jgi:nucleotide-binding universal stress UspA family protein
VTRIDTLLVPLDGSELSEVAVPVAVRLAGRLEASVHLFGVVAGADEVDDRDAALAAVEEDIEGVKVERSVVVDLDVAGAIHEAHRRLGAATICMASHGRGRSAALVGSVATDVVRRGHDPLIVVGPFADERRWRRLSRGVVACVAETATPSSRELAAALEWSDLLGEAMTVITVAEPVPEPIRPVPVRRLFGPDGDVEAFLTSLVEPLRQSVSPSSAPSAAAAISTQPVFDPISPVQGVVDWVDWHMPSLVVVGSRARSGLARLVFGSASAGIIHRSPAPALVVPVEPLSGE